MGGKIRGLAPVPYVFGRPLLHKKAFLSNRRMAVRVGQNILELREVNGGCIQGSLLGILQHNVCLDHLDDDLDVDSSKYVDDMFLLEGLHQAEAEEDEEGKILRARSSEHAFKIIKNRAEAVNMKVNADKTTHLCICLLYTSPSPRDLSTSRMPSSA